MGSGGLGGYFGALLARGGTEVSFIARGAHLEAIRQKGLRVEGGPDPFLLEDVRATDEPREVGPVDLVMVCVKLWDTEAALEQARPLVGPETTLVSFQNGVPKDSFLRAAYDESQLIGGVAYVASTLSRPGVITRTGPLQRLIFGEFNGNRSERVEAFHAACRGGRDRRRGKRRHPPRDVGEVRIPGRAFGNHGDDAGSDRPDPRARAVAGVLAGSDARGGGGWPNA